METFRTKDFYLSCTLLSNNIKLIKSEKDSIKNTVFFTFDVSNNQDIYNEIIHNFVNQQCFVNVKKFTWAMKVLREELSKWK